MANIQLQKTITKTAITQKQSLEVVQTLLHGGLSSLAYLRDFFHDKAFLEQVYDNEKIHPYEDYAAGKLPKKSWEVAGSTTKMQILKRGGSKRADMFLDWLEGGVFKALKDGTLHSLEVYVHPDSNDRERVIEQYTFSITYAPGSDSGQSLARLEMDSDGSPTVTLEATSDALTSLLKQIMTVCRSLPELPAKKFVTMRLFYTQETRRPPKLSGWMPSASDSVFFAECDGWEKHVQHFKALNSGLYSSLLKIDHLQPIGEDAKKKFPGYNPATIPKELRFDQPLREQDKWSDMPARDRILKIIDSLEPHSDVEEEEEIGEEDRSTVLSPNTPYVDNSNHTQASNVSGMVNGLGRMLQREVLTQGDTQTQALVHSRPTNQPTKSTQPKLTTRTANRLESTRQGASNEEDESLVSCQCGYEEDEGQMISCSYCNTWQHLHCYGFTSESDPRLPPNHVCYKCLLGGKEDGVLKKLAELAQRRRGLCFTLRNGLKGQREFITDMRMSSTNGAAVYKFLKEEGYVAGAKGSHKPGYAAAGKPQFVPMNEGAPLEKMLANLFNPMMLIEHHYEIPANFAVPTEVLAKQLPAPRKTMPPPITPASQSKNDSQQTPSADLDLRASMTPYETPIRVKSHPPTKKRANDENGHNDMPWKRRVAARLPSNSTAFMLDAGVISPTPTFIQGSDMRMQTSDPIDR